MSLLDEFPLEAGEEKIKKWTIVYVPPEGGRYNGDLLVTNNRLLYDAKFDISAGGVIDQALLARWDKGSCIAIPKSRIAAVDAKKSFFSKKVMITLDDGKVHTFNNGMLNIDPVVAAINQR